MSVVLGYACDEYSIILSDKRAVDKKDGHINDHTDKLALLSNKGWASAVGHAGLAQVTFDELESKNINDHVEIINSYQKMYDLAVNNDVLENNDGSMLIFTFPDLFRQTFKLYTLYGRSPQLKPIAFEKKIIVNGAVNNFSEISSKYSYGQIKTGSLNTIVYIMQSMFRDIASESEYISRYFDIGISYIENRKIKIGRISRHLSVVDTNYDWMSQISWIN